MWKLKNLSYGLSKTPKSLFDMTIVQQLEYIYYLKLSDHDLQNDLNKLLDNK